MTAVQDEPVDLATATVARRSAGLTVSSIAGSILAVGTSFLLARWLGPARFGRVQQVLLLYFYAALLRSGAFENAVRRYIRLQAEGRPDEARRVRDVGTTIDFVISTIPPLVLVVAALVSHDPLLRRGLWLAPFAVLASTVAAYFGGLRSADGRFDLVAGAGLVRSLSYTVVALIGVATLGDWALFLAPAVADTVALVVLLRRRPTLKFRPTFDRSEAWSLLRGGVALGVLPVVYWVYRMVGSTSLAWGTSAATFGMFMFAAAPIAVLLRAISTVESVLTPAVWRELALDDGDRRWLGAADRLTLTLFVVAGFATNLAQAGFAPVVRRFVPAYVGAIPTFDVLALNVLLLSVAVVPSLVLRDERHGTQNWFLFIWVTALAGNIVANIVVLHVGGGMIGVAWNDIGIQAVVLVVVFGLAARRLGVPGWARRTAVSCVPPVAACAMVALLLEAEDRRVVGLGDTIGQTGGRLLAVVAAWAAVAWSLRRRLTSPR